ncbi:hypothetical protein H5T87_08700 [bacterium]|nr:hypothetical protein [bacterium]
MRRLSPFNLFILLMFFFLPQLSSANAGEGNLPVVAQKLAEKESHIRSLSLIFTMSVERDEEVIEKIIGEGTSLKEKGAATAQKMPSSREYLWLMKGEKLRLERREKGKQEGKLLGSFDGEKFYRFFYYEELVENQKQTGTSGKFKPGDIVQVHIYKNPVPLTDGYYMGDIYGPLNYLGLGINKEMLGKLFKESKVSVVGKEKIGGTLCDVIEIIKDEEFPTSTGGKTIYRWRWKLWVDPNADWNILRRVDYAPDGRVVYTLEFEEYKRYGEGVLLPTKATSTLYAYDRIAKKNIQVSRKTLVVKECKINEEIPDHEFSPQIPDGVLVWNAITDETYIAGEKQPTDEDILQVAKVARQFIDGTIKMKEIEMNYGPQKGKRSERFCGPNALLAVCGIFDVKTSSQEIARLAGADEKGFTSMAGLKRAAEALGLKAEGVDLTVEELREELRKSNKVAIAFLPPAHFIVVVGFADDKVVLIDPPTMLGATPVYALDELWDGRALLISKP